jgi:hypothetical protein
MPRQAQFYPLFERHAAVVVSAHGRSGQCSLVAIS